jgi:amino acid transporter
LEGVTAGAIALALTFALLSSAGFEGAASAGEETKNPRRTIPRALVWTTIATSVFFIGVTTVAVWAFGVKPNELEKFTAAGSVPADIATAYVGDALGDLITLGGAISSFACMIGAQVAGGRILFAFGRAGVLPSRFGQLSAQETPIRGSTAVGITALLFTLFAAAVTRFTAFSAFELTSDTAGVLYAGAYATACLAAAFVLWRKSSTRLMALLPALGVVILLGVIVLQLFPVPSGWELIAPVVAVLVLIGGAVFGRARGDRAAEALR